MHSFTSCLVHVIFSTKLREPLLAPEIQERLWPYLAGIARQHEMKSIAVGGATDHVHMLPGLPPTLSVAKAMQLLKGNSSKWLRETFPNLARAGFAWQEGYGAFSIGVSGLDDTVAYIRAQEEHHRKLGVREELEIFLRKHGMSFDAARLDE